MRFSTMAIIFQSTSLLAVGHAALTIGHIAEKNKGFTCNGAPFLEGSYRTQRIDANNRIRNYELEEISQRVVDEFLSSETNAGPVMYGDGEEVTYYLYKLENFGTRNSILRRNLIIIS
ncbi:CELP0003 Effector like protein [Blumeria hordei DH14]|uniref:CELP0003 Effector like protein n=1 Tax=Blumeria graminis f. sp. hordei (strain DH14) TaxID=546991 RepID=N1JF22_BLUG1|nr:CELP0003 Effector like protein [Blumeria hordei DH14]